MCSFEALVREAAEVAVDGWNFSWLTGRATEDRPPWGYARNVASRLARARAALDLQTGGGEVLAEAGSYPPVMVATEAWPPNLAVASSRLHALGIAVVQHDGAGPLPFADAAFDLVTSRHPVSTNWPEIARVLTPDGTYFSQQVGPASMAELSEAFLGPLPDAHRWRRPEDARAAAETAGLEVLDLRTATLRAEYYDIGAIVYVLRKCVWWVPNFTVEGYEDTLRFCSIRSPAKAPSSLTPVGSSSKPARDGDDGRNCGGHRRDNCSERPRPTMNHCRSRTKAGARPPVIAAGYAVVWKVCRRPGPKNPESCREPNRPKSSRRS